jgi:signal transduction histidine kinase
MRRPLKYQLLVPWLAVTLAIVGTLSVVGAWLASQRVRSDLQRSLRESARTLVEANFPVEDSVLRQARRLSGATFVAVSDEGRIRATSAPGIELPAESPAVTSADALELSKRSMLGEETYFHAVVELDRRPVGGRRERLHIFYPERQLQEARWQAFWPPLLAGGVATVLLLGVATVMAARVTRPIEQLGRHAELIARGRFEPLALPQADDEIRDLAVALNRTTEMLARYEDEVRRSERLSTLGQLGGGMAHQIRNALTGCRMALDLHRSECAGSSADAVEALAVAMRQIHLMEHYLQRFLTLGRPGEQVRQTFDLREVIEQSLPLVRPSAQHVGVLVAVDLPPHAAMIEGDPRGVEQALVNLVLNAVEAAASPAAVGARSTDVPAQVTITLHVEGSAALLDVRDTGPGVPPAMVPRLFEPFASDKADGVGLGLVTARDLIRAQGGEVEYLQQPHPACFRIRLARWDNRRAD